MNENKNFADKTARAARETFEKGSAATQQLLNASLLTDGKQFSGAYHTPRSAGLGKQERALLAQVLPAKGR